MRLTNLSASRISAFYQCQMEYHAIYDLKMADKHPHPLSLMGSSVHKLMEIATKARASGRRENLWNPLDYKNTIYDRYKLPPDLRKVSDVLIQNAINWGYFNKVTKDTKCELGFNVKLGNECIIGEIDRLDIADGNADIIDLKTKKNKYLDSELDFDWQAKIYNIAVRKMYPHVKNVKVSFWTLRHQVQRVWKTQEDADNDEAELMRIASSIRDCQNPIAKVTPLCEWCCYKDQCDKFKTRKKYGIKKSFRFFKKD